ncbi:MAG: hydroxylase, partial [Mesorhizobium sp.]
MNETQHELPILVTGAAGRIGSVGRIVTELLLAQAITVKELC